LLKEIQKEVLSVLKHTMDNDKEKKTYAYHSGSRWRCCGIWSDVDIRFVGVELDRCRLDDVVGIAGWQPMPAGYGSEIVNWQSPYIF